MEAAEQQVGTAAQSREAAIQLAADVSGRKENSVAEVTFDISMAKLFWIQFWGIRGQELNMNFRMAGEIMLNHSAEVGARVVPLVPAPSAGKSASWAYGDDDEDAPIRKSLSQH